MGQDKPKEAIAGNSPDKICSLPEASSLAKKYSKLMIRVGKIEPNKIRILHAVLSGYHDGSVPSTGILGIYTQGDEKHRLAILDTFLEECHDLESNIFYYDFLTCVDVPKKVLKVEMFKTIKFLNKHKDSLKTFVNSHGPIAKELRRIFKKAQ